jgi:hypothetical protein
MAVIATAALHSISAFTTGYATEHSRPASAGGQDRAHHAASGGQDRAHHGRILCEHQWTRRTRGQQREPHFDDVTEFGGKTTPARVELFELR